MPPRPLLPIVIAMLAVIGTARADPVPDDVGARVATGFAQPAAHAFAESATALAGQVEALCASPGEASLAAARTAFADTVATWGRVSVLRFGPLVADNRYERAFFWPDPRGVILRQVQGLLGEADEAALAPGALGGKSVAVQGLPALEFVLYGGGAGELAAGQAAYRCRYGAAVAVNLAEIARAAEAGWADGSPFREAFTAPFAAADLYRSKGEVAGEIVKALGTALQYTRNAELLPALGDTADAARGKRAPLWRSDRTFALVGARIDGLLDLVAAAGFDADPTAAAYVGSIRFDLSHARDALDAVTTPAQDAFGDADDRGRLAYVAAALHGANETTGGGLSGALGLTMGFNALDGD